MLSSRLVGSFECSDVIQLFHPQIWNQPLHFTCLGCVWGDDLWDDSEHISRGVCFEGSGQIPLSLSWRRGELTCLTLLFLKSQHIIPGLTITDVTLNGWKNLAGTLKHLFFMFSVLPGPCSAFGAGYHGVRATRECSGHLSPSCDALSARLLPRQKCRSVENRCTQTFTIFTGLQQQIKLLSLRHFTDDLPYMKCPLHTVLKLTPVAYGTFGVHCDT